MTEHSTRLARQIDPAKCLDCSEPSYVSVSYHVSAGPTLVYFCREHAAAWWTKWKNTAAGETATFSSVQRKK